MLPLLIKNAWFLDLFEYLFLYSMTIIMFILVSIIIANIILIDCRTIVVTVPNKDEPNCVFTSVYSI